MGQVISIVVMDFHGPWNSRVPRVKHSYILPCWCCTATTMATQYCHLRGQISCSHVLRAIHLHPCLKSHLHCTTQASRTGLTFSTTSHCGELRQLPALPSSKLAHPYLHYHGSSVLLLRLGLWPSLPNGSACDGAGLVLLSAQVQVVKREEKGWA